MPLDPYFTRDGEKHFTLFGQPRATFTEKEKAEGEALLRLPEAQRAARNERIGERLRLHIHVTRAELFFHHRMQRLYYHRRHMAPRLVRRAEADARQSAHAHA